jgi:hypothetical protein
MMIAMIVRELASFASFADAGDTACTSCGMTLVEPPFADSDYLEMIMKARPPSER